MSLSSSETDINKGLGKLQLTSGAVQEEKSMDDVHSCKKTLSIKDLPDDCLSHVYKRLKSGTDHSSFGLDCHLWLDSQRNNHESLWDIDDSKCSLRRLDSGASKYTDKKMSLIFSSFPHLASVGLKGSHITNKGFEIMVQCCARGFLIQNCLELHSIRISYCRSVTGIGCLGCQKTLTNVYVVDVPKLTTEGIKAIASGSGLQHLCLSGNPVNNEAVITISKSCPVLKVLQLTSCHEVQLEGWKAIGLYCRNLKFLYIFECLKLCDQGMEALCYGSNKLSYLSVYPWSDFARELFKRERPNVRLIGCSR
ncbi:hypothetical protein MKW98_020692 [Papaver atlanticum]|uniref:Uncharacterized protein n=1 Tax=Papaver atlanticum TaxID=357466 RepID=A0AAD4TIG2_9MAGN|nr:hypothetical protein MKW98_020692 [Papaver atlanticum]